MSEMTCLSSLTKNKSFNCNKKLVVKNASKTLTNIVVQNDVYFEKHWITIILLYILSLFPRNQHQAGGNSYPVLEKGRVRTWILCLVSCERGWQPGSTRVRLPINWALGKTGVTLALLDRKVKQNSTSWVGLASWDVPMMQTLNHWCSRERLLGLLKY
jgi:hypothetical protein